MHEYGHNFDSQIWGWLYLPVIGLNPYWIVVLVSQLPQKFRGGKALFGACEEMHRDKPIPQRQLAAMHDRTRLEALPVTALLAFEALLVLLPVVVLASTHGTYNTLFFSILFQFHFTSFLIGKQIVEFNNIHNLSFFCKDRQRVCQIAIYQRF